MKKEMNNSSESLALNKGTTSVKKTYTKAGIDEETLINIFGIGLGIYDCSTKSLEDIARIVDSSYPTKEDIEGVIEDYITDFVERGF